MIFDKQVILHPWLLTRSLAHRVRTDSLLRNSIFIMATTVATAGIGYFYWIIAAHIYSTQAVGLASALIAAMTLTSTVSSMGISYALVQMLPRREAGYAWSLTLNAGLAVGISTSLLGGIIVVVALPLFSHQFAIVGLNAGYGITFVIGASLVTAATLLDRTFVAERATGNMLARNVAFAVLKLLLVLLSVLLLAQMGALAIFSSWVIAVAATVALGMLLLLPRLGRGYRLVMHGIVKQVRKMLSSIVGHHFINIGGMLPQYLLPLLVTARLAATDNAYYYTTAMVGDFFFLVSSAVAVSLFAEGSHAADDLLRKARSSAVITGIVLAPAMLTVFLGGHYILLVFGPNYARHGLLLLMILTIGAVPDAITNIYVSVLRVQGRLRWAALLNLGMASITLTLSWVLLPVLGIAGTGWAFLIAQIAGSLVAGVDITFVRRHQRRISGAVAQSDSGRGETGDAYRPI